MSLRFSDRWAGVLRSLFQTTERISEALKSDDYRGMYRRLVQRRVYNAKMLDGALMQFMYEFSGRTLLRHRPSSPWTK